MALKVICFSVALMLFIASSGANLFFDYGILRGSHVYGGQDDYCEGVELNTTLRFYDVDYDEIYACSNGYISFGASNTQLAVSGLNESNTPVAALLFHDLTTGGDNGLLYYQELTADDYVLDDIDSAITDAGFDYSTSLSAFLITFTDVTFLWDSTQDVTMQAAVATDGTYTYCIFNYIHVGVIPDGDIGFYGGVGMYTHPYSESHEDFPNLSTHSNVGVAGRWIYRVDTSTDSDPNEMNIAEGTDIGGDELPYRPELLFSFGALAGDERMIDYGDLCSEVNTGNFTFFENSYDSLHVCRQGIIIFDEEWANLTSTSFPSTSFPVIAAFWEDTNTDLEDSDAAVFYRYDDSSSVLEEIDEAIQSVACDYGMTTSALIATWVNVALTVDLNETSTFQAAIATDGSYTYVIFNYYELDFTTDTAIMGFDAGNMEQYYEHPDSLTYDLNDLDSESNVDVTGRLIYRIDADSITEPETAESCGSSEENSGIKLGSSILKLAAMCVITTLLKLL